MNTNPTFDELAAMDPAGVQLKPISFLDEQSLELAYPQPEPPLGQDPSKGSLAPEDFPLYNDRAYRRQWKAWNDRFDLLKFIVASGACLGTLDWASANKDGSGENWCTSAIEIVGGSVGSVWVESASKRLDSLKLSKLVRSESKNSSAPSPGHPQRPANPETSASMPSSQLGTPSLSGSTT